MLTTGEQQGGACVAQIVEPDIWQTGPLEERLERGSCEVAEVQRLATVGAKDQSAILHVPPSLSRSAFWAALWTLSASTVWPSITSVTSRSGIPAGLSAWALAEALPGALPKMSSSPAAGDEQGEGVTVLGAGDVEGER